MTDHHHHLGSARRWVLPVLAAGALQLAAAPGFALQVVYQDGQTDPFLGGTYTGVEDVWVFTNGGGYFNDAWTNTGPDTRMDVGIPNEGTGDNIQWVRRELVRFPLASLAGQYATINSVTLELTLLNSPQGSGFLNAHGVTAADANWQEGTGGANGNGSSWAYKINQTSTAWAGGGGAYQATGGAGVAGADYLAAPLGATAFNSGMTAGSTLSIAFNDVSLIDDWAAGVNSGILLKTGSDAVGSRIMFHSSESATASARPKLIVDYTPTPEPAAGALLALGASAMLLRRWRG